MIENWTGFNYKGDHFRGVNAHWLNKDQKPFLNCFDCGGAVSLEFDLEPVSRFVLASADVVWCRQCFLRHEMFKHSELQGGTYKCEPFIHLRQQWHRTLILRGLNPGDIVRLPETTLGKMLKLGILLEREIPLKECQKLDLHGFKGLSISKALGLQSETF